MRLPQYGLRGLLTMMVVAFVPARLVTVADVRRERLKAPSSMKPARLSLAPT